MKKSRNSLAYDFRMAKSSKKPQNERQSSLRKAITVARKKGGVSIDKVKKQTGAESYSVKMDRKRNALVPGWRISKNGNLYYETRRNRSDRMNSRL